MPFGRDHHAADCFDISVGNAGLEEIAHRIHKHELWRAPEEGFGQFLRDQTQVEPLLVGMPLHAAKPLRECLGVAMLAAGADFRAAADRVPGRVGPFNVGILD
jgi:hypothetical protein